MPPEDSHPPRSRRSRSRPRKRSRQLTDLRALNRPASEPIPRLQLVKDPKNSRKPKRKTRAASQLPPRPSNRSRQMPPPAIATPRFQHQTLWRLFLWLVRGVIGSVGAAVIAGTVLSLVGGQPYVETPTDAILASSVGESLEAMTQLPLTAEITPLQEKIVAIAQEAAPLEPSIFALDLDTGAYLNYLGGNPMPAASTIKLPILVAFFQDVDAGKVDLKEKLVMEPEMIAGGSGNMQYSKPGTEYTALETAKRMITISDNTATNMLIKRLGGPNLLNQRFATWGLNATAIHERLPDLTGKNQTSAVDLTHLLVQVNQGELVSLPARDQMLGMMRAVQNKALLPKGLDNKATIAHKTGDIKSMLGDVGIVDTPTGRRYAVVVMVNRPDNDLAARGLIQNLSRHIYQYFQQPMPLLPQTPQLADPNAPAVKVEANTQP